ncbi:histidine kinase [Dawidia soli]|uniref:Histidine kinase n=1 Tax=Dawidia soli TaxID=2782352 RepID=A0AAP2DFC1_9BACT|nr:histidine kinase [Dawidia soli]MBT1690227.1 histidine kinase [Dawidia soli]
MIRYTLTWCLMAFLCVSNAVAQDKKASPAKQQATEHEPDAVEDKASYKAFKKLSRRTNPTELLDEAAALKDSNPGEAFNKVREALGLSLASGDVLNEARSHILIGEINEGIQEWKLARENYLQAYQILQAYKDSKGVTTTTADYQRTLRGLGTTNLELGDFPSALQYFQQALDLRPDRNQRIDRTLDLSETYYQMGQYTEALRALDDLPPPVGKKEISSSNTLDMRVQNQKAKIFARLNDIPQTKDLYDNSLTQLRANKSDAEGVKSLQETKEEIADVLRGQNLYDDEIELRNKSIAFNLESKNLDEVTNDKVEISKTLVAKGEDAAALREIEEAARIADTLTNPQAQANAYRTLADIYEKNGRTTQALGAYRKYSDAVTRSQRIQEERQITNSSLLRQQRDIEELSKEVSVGKREETIEQATVSRQRLAIYGLLVILLITTVTSYYIYKNAQASKVANQLLALKSLRSQMNPHFIFNALNSVNHFVAEQDERAANKFLSEFSQLMRLVLENSQEDFIPLFKEQEILALYLKLEHYRFRDKFDYRIDTDESINAEAIEVPPMLIQPYIENAVWHGLRYKEEKGMLTLRIYQQDATLMVEITDDGIGRKRSAALKTANQKKHNSTGLKNIQERLDIINRVYNADYRVTIEDLEPGPGTRVRIALPLHTTKRILP